MAMDADTFKAAMSRWGSGVSIITSLDDQGGPIGFTATSLTSVSLSPPMVLFCLARDAGVAPVFAQAEAFAAHILSSEQQALSNTFAQSGVDRFAGVETRAGFGGVPVLSGVLATLECKITDRHEGGDHIIIVGEVQEGSVLDDGVLEDGKQEAGKPLLYFKGRYASL
jgi:flavin reductase (DIM6/NTAB) family NADH-FMN oxidoreductase RutF